MKEWNEAEILNSIQGGTFGLYLFTPMCGTCQVASRMLHIVEEIAYDKQLVKSNANFTVNLARQYEVESVPCLLLFKNGILVKKVYAFRSVPYLLEIIQKTL